MTDIVESTLLQRISELVLFVSYVTAVENTAGPSETGQKLLAHLRRELATEQRNLRRLQWERGERFDWTIEWLDTGEAKVARTVTDTGKPWPWGMGE